MTFNKKPENEKQTQNKRPIWLFGLIGVIVLSAGIPLLNDFNKKTYESEYQGGPRISVDQDYFDYGEIPNGKDPIRTNIWVSNVGDRTLNFSEAPYIELVEGCCPPVPAIGSLTLKPGEGTLVRMDFFMHGDMGGEHNFQLHLPTNDSVEPDKTITILSNWVD